MDAESSSSNKAMEALERPHKKHRKKKPQIKPTTENNISYIEAWKDEEFIDMILESPQLRDILANRTVPISFEGMSVPNPTKARVAIAMLRSAYWVWLKRWSQALAGAVPRPAAVAAARQSAHPAIRRLDEKLEFLWSLLKYGIVEKPQILDGCLPLSTKPKKTQRKAKSKALESVTFHPDQLPPTDLPQRRGRRAALRTCGTVKKSQSPDGVLPPPAVPKPVRRKAKLKALQTMTLQPKQVPPKNDLQKPQKLGRRAALRMVSSYLARHVRASYRSGRGSCAVFAELAAKTGLREAQVAAFWCRIRAVSLRHIRSLLASGDTASPLRRPRRADWAVADTALLYDTQETVVTEDSLTLYPQSQPLWALLELVDRWLLEPGTAAVWRAAKAQYARRGGGVNKNKNCRRVSLVLLQRRWHELKVSAAERVLALWRARRRERDRSKDGGTEDKESELPRLHLVQLAVVRRLPGVALRRPRGWHARVRAGLVHLEDDEQDGPPQPPEPAPVSGKAPEVKVVITESPVGTVEPPPASPQEQMGEISETPIKTVDPLLADSQGQKGEAHSPDNDEIPRLVIDTDRQTSSESANSFPAFASLDLNTVKSAIIFSDDDSDDDKLDVDDARTGEDSVSDSDKAMSVSEVNTTKSSSEAVTGGRTEAESVRVITNGNFDSTTEAKIISNSVSVSISNVTSSAEKSLTASEFDKASVNQSEVPNEIIIKEEPEEESSIPLVDRIVYGDDEDFDEETADLTDEDDNNFEEIDVKTEAIDENVEEMAEVSADTDAVEPDVEKLQDKDEYAPFSDLKLLQSPIVPLKKLEIRQQGVKPYANNPDFNIELKSLSPAFLKSRRNCKLLKKCRPLTVNVVRMDMSYIEKKREEKELQEYEEFVRKEREMLERFYEAEDDDDGDDMPTLEELQEFLNVIEAEKLFTAGPLEATPSGEFCCLARFHLGSGDAPYNDLATHTAERCIDCHCCCAHLLLEGDSAEVLSQARIELACDLAKALREASAKIERPMLEVITSGEDDKSESDDNDLWPSFPKKRKKRIRTKNPESAKRKSQPEVSEVEDDPYAEWERQKNLNKQYFILPQPLPNSKRSEATMEECKDIDRFKKPAEVKAKCVKRKAVMEETVKNRAQEMVVPGKNTARDLEVPVKIRALDVVDIPTKIRAQNMEVPVKNRAEDMEVPVKNRAQDMEVPVETRAQDMEVPVKRTVQKTKKPCKIKIDKVKTVVDKQAAAVPPKISAQETEVPVINRDQKTEVPTRSRTQEKGASVIITAVDLEIPDKRTVQESEKPSEIKIVKTVVDKPASPVPAKIRAQEVEVSVKNRVPEVEVPVKNRAQKTEAPGKTTVQETEIPCEIKIEKVDTVEDKPASPVPANQIRAQDMEVPVKSRTQEKGVSVICKAQNMEVPVKNRTQEAEVPASNINQEMGVSVICRTQKTEVPVKNRTQEAEVPVQNRTQETQVPVKRTDEGAVVPCDNDIVKIENMKDEPALPEVRPPVRLIRMLTPNVSNQDLCNQFVSNQDVANQGVIHPPVSSQAYQQPLLNISLQVNPMEQSLDTVVPTYAPPLISVAVLNQQNGGKVYQPGQTFQQPGQMLNQAGQIYQQNQLFQTPGQMLNQQQPIFQNQQSQFQQPGPMLNQQATPMFQQNPIFQQAGQIFDQQAQVYQQNQMYQQAVQFLKQSTGQIFQPNQLLPQASDQILNQQSIGQVLDQPRSSGQFYQLQGQQYHQNQVYPPGVPDPGYQNHMGIMPQIPVSSHQMLNFSNQSIDVTHMLNSAQRPASTDQTVIKQNLRLDSAEPDMGAVASMVQQVENLRLDSAEPDMGAVASMVQQVETQITPPISTTQSVMNIVEVKSSDQAKPIVYLTKKPQTDTSRAMAAASEPSKRWGDGPRSGGPVIPQVETPGARAVRPHSLALVKVPGGRYQLREILPQGLGAVVGANDPTSFTARPCPWAHQVHRSRILSASEHVRRLRETRHPVVVAWNGRAALPLFEGHCLMTSAYDWWGGVEALGADTVQYWSVCGRRLPPSLVNKESQTIKKGKRMFIQIGEPRTGVMALVLTALWWESITPYLLQKVQVYLLGPSRIPRVLQMRYDGLYVHADSMLALRALVQSVNKRFPNTIDVHVCKQSKQASKASQTAPAQGAPQDQKNVNSQLPNLINMRVGQQPAVILASKSPGKAMQSLPAEGSRKTPEYQKIVNSRLPNTINMRVGNQPDVIVASKSPGKALQISRAEGSQTTPDDQKNVDSRVPNTINARVGQQPAVILATMSPGKAVQPPPAERLQKTPDDQKNVNSRLPNTMNMRVGQQPDVGLVSKSPGKPLQISPAEGSQKSPDYQKNVNSRVPNTMNVGVGQQPAVILASMSPGKALQPLPAERLQKTPDDQKNVNSRVPNTMNVGVGKQPAVIVVSKSNCVALQPPPAERLQKTPDDQKNVNSRVPNTINMRVGQQPAVIVAPKSPGKPLQISPAEGSQKTPDYQKNVNSWVPHTMNDGVGKQPAVILASMSPGKALQPPPAERSQKTPDDQKNVNMRVGKQPAVIVVSKRTCKVLQPRLAGRSQKTPDDQKNVNSRVPNTINARVGQQPAVILASMSPGKALEPPPAERLQKTPDDQKNVNSRLPNTMAMRVGKHPVVIVASKGGSQKTLEELKKFRVVWRRLPSSVSEESQKGEGSALQDKSKAVAVCLPYKGKHSGSPQRPSEACDPLRSPNEGSSGMPRHIPNPGGSTATTKVLDKPIMSIDPNRIICIDSDSD